MKYDELISRDDILRVLASAQHPWNDFEDAYEIVQNYPAIRIDQTEQV